MHLRTCRVRRAWVIFIQCRLDPADREKKNTHYWVFVAETSTPRLFDQLLAQSSFVKFRTVRQGSVYDEPFVWGVGPPVGHAPS